VVVVGGAVVGGTVGGAVVGGTVVGAVVDVAGALDFVDRGLVVVVLVVEVVAAVVLGALARGDVVLGAVVAGDVVRDAVEVPPAAATTGVGDDVGWAANTTMATMATATALAANPTTRRPCGGVRGRLVSQYTGTTPSGSGGGGGDRSGPS